MSVVRGRPPGLAGGSRGASRAYCSSLSACPAPKSPTKARFSAVHMACLQEGLLPSLNRRHGHSASSSVSTARASQTASQLAAKISGVSLDDSGGGSLRALIHYSPDVLLDAADIDHVNSGARGKIAIIE